MSPYRVIGGALGSVMLVAASLQPARGDAQKGGQLARQWCAGCHVIGEAPAGAVQQGPPSFPTIAHSGLTAGQLGAFLAHPHGAMPDLALTRVEIDDLIDYIDTLR